MCGISGIYRVGGINPDDIELVKQMNQRLRHRGPDGEGLYSNRCCVLGHRRLAVIDLSADGQQPFASDDSRFQIIYNGEIYNYIELREELRSSGWTFRTKTNTQIFLKTY